MAVTEPSNSSRLATILEMLEEVSRQTDPNEAVLAFSRRMSELHSMDTILSVSTRSLPPGEYKITRARGIDLPDSAPLMGLGPLRADENSPHGSVQNPWLDWDLITSRRGGFIGDAIAAARPQVLGNLEIRGDSVLGDALADMGSCLIVPSYDGGEMLNWLFSFRRDPLGFSAADLEMWVMITNLFGSMTRNLVSVKRAQQLNSALSAQFEEVARVQQSLLPRRNPEIRGLTIATSYLTSEQAGGDYYDFFDLGDGRWGLLIADVAGHGAGAATIMAMLHAILHGYPDLHEGPARILEHANERLIAAQMESSFVTAIFAVYDPTTRDLTFCRAGHPPPLRKERPTGRVTALDEAGSLPIGILPDFAAAERTIRLEPGDTIILYTDGITEEFNAKGDMFGVEGLERALTGCSGEPDCVVDSVHAALYAHTGHRTRQDDQTLVVFQVAGDGARDA